MFGRFHCFYSLQHQHEQMEVRTMKKGIAFAIVIALTYLEPSLVCTGEVLDSPIRDAISDKSHGVLNGKGFCNPANRWALPFKGSVEAA